MHHKFLSGKLNGKQEFITDFFKFSAIWRPYVLIMEEKKTQTDSYANILGLEIIPLQILTYIFTLQLSIHFQAWTSSSGICRLIYD